MPSVRLTLLGRPGCHLCDDARAVVTHVIADLEGTASVEFVERSIADDPELESRYRDEIPVVLLDDAVHTIWRVDPGMLRQGILDAAAGRTSS